MVTYGQRMRSQCFMLTSGALDIIAAIAKGQDGLALAGDGYSPHRCPTGPTPELSQWHSSCPHPRPGGSDSGGSDGSGCSGTGTEVWAWQAPAKRFQT